MGGWFSFLWPWGSKPRRVIILGLDGAGKTTLLHKLKLGEVLNSVPTVGFNLESIHYKNISFLLWDVGGQDKIRSLWRHYFADTDAVIWVLDSSDVQRVAESKEELQRVLGEDSLAKVPLLVFANKQDLPNAMTTSEVMQNLELEPVVSRRPVKVQPTVVPAGQGIWEGLDWLCTVLIK
jgi:small GTP-binding protein